MEKIIKPLLNEDGTQAVRNAKNGEWYFNNDRYLEWCNSFDDSTLKYPIYYAEEWRPKENERYWFFAFDDNTAYSTNYNPELSGLDRLRILIGNFFQSEEQANNNVLKVLDNMKKYYQEKSNGGGDEKL